MCASYAIYAVYAISAFYAIYAKTLFGVSRWGHISLTIEAHTVSACVGTSCIFALARNTIPRGFYGGTWSAVPIQRLAQLYDIYMYIYILHIASNTQHI